jgi:hypothetical protein
MRGGKQSSEKARSRGLLVMRAGALALLAATALCHAQPAQFRVTADVVHADVLPFTATISGAGNSLINEGAGFEPVVYRTRYLALEDSPSRVVVSPPALSHYDTLREGFLDQAAVQVYRIENGRFRMVREDRVAAGGFHVSGWHRAIDDNRLVSPASPRFTYRWEPWNRPRATYYFTVRAIDRSGNLSPPAGAVAIDWPGSVAKGEAANSLVDFRPSRVRRLIDKLPSLSGPLPAPNNLRGKLADNGDLALQWDAVDERNLAGYVVYRSDAPPQQHRGFFLQLAKAPAAPGENIRAGDLVMVSKKIYAPSRNRFLSNRVWGAENEHGKILPGLVKFFPDEDAAKSWRLAPHARNTPVEEPGETYLELKLPAGAREALSTYNHSGTGQDYYEVLEKRPYKVEVWLRQEGTGTVRFKLGGFYDRPPQKIEPVEFRVGREWKKYVATFTPPAVQPGADAGNMMLEFTGPGVFSVDNFRVYRADAEYLDLLPEEYAAIASAHLSALRTHGSIKTDVRSYDLEQLTNSAGVISGTQKLNTLPQILKVMRKAGVRPWLQIEFHLAPQDWLALAEYLAAPYDPKLDTPAAKPWAYKRYAQGQARPWTEEFDRIYLELSNETWNRMFYPWVFDAMTDAATGKSYSPGQVYGLFQEHVISLLRSSPYWRRAGVNDKVQFVLGGWAGQSYGAEAAAASPSSDLMAIGAYLGGWDEGEGPPALNRASLFDLLSHVSQSIPVAERHLKEADELRKRGHGKLRIGTYEAGPGYAMNGLNNARVTEEQFRAQEQVMKSLAAGTATLDAFLARAYRGFEVQNFFTFGRGYLWTSHAKWYLGGQAYPSWKLLALFNGEATGDMLRTENLSVPTADLKAFERRQAVKDAPLAAVYATRAPGRLNLFVLSRKVEGFTPLTVELPFERADSITLYRMSGAPEANNLMADNVKIEKLAIPASQSGRRFSVDASSGADERGLPPAATFLYVFEGIKPALK